MSGAAPSSSGGDAGLSLLPASLSPPLASSAPPTPLARLESHLSASLHHLWTSSLIVEQGVAPIPPQSIGDDSLERLMGMAHPRMDIQDVTNQNLQKQMDGYLQSLLDIDRDGRALQHLTVPKSVIECVETGHNPRLISQRHIEETKFKHESVRAKVFATKVLHDQLQLRMSLWDSMLAQEAAAGNKASHAMLHSTLDTLRTHTVEPIAAAETATE